MAFIDEIYPHAQRIQKENGILASLIIAQAIHESNWGKSGLAVKGKNLFGIKGSYNGQSVTMQTWEVYNGKRVTVDAAFRKYPSWYESLCDLADLYKNGVSWDRNKYKAIIGEKDYKKAARAVQAAGYATDPQYADKIIRIIEGNGLAIYDAVPKQKEEEVKKTEQTALKLYKVVKNVPGYVTAADAKARKNEKTTVTAGTYSVFNESNGMVNVTTKAGSPGSWINPSDNNKSSTSSAEFHIVKSGENMTKIAQRHKTTLATLKKLNPTIKNINLIYPGQKIRVK